MRRFFRLKSPGNACISGKVSGIDVFIDGHSHSTLDDVKAATDGTGKVGDTLLTSTGTAAANNNYIRGFFNRFTSQTKCEN